MEEETLDGLRQAITHIKNAINDFNIALEQCQDYSSDMTQLQTDLKTIYDNINDSTYVSLTELIMKHMTSLLSDL